jgi:hypothetical protein
VFAPRASLLHFPGHLRAAEWASAFTAFPECDVSVVDAAVGHVRFADRVPTVFAIVGADAPTVAVACSPSVSGQQSCPASQIPTRACDASMRFRERFHCLLCIGAVRTAVIVPRALPGAQTTFSRGRA